jgi:hypothetical protein
MPSFTTRGVRARRDHASELHRLRDRALGRRSEIGAHDEREADPEVEGPHHLVVGNVTSLLEEAEDARDLPGAGLDLDSHAIRQRARDVVDPSAASQVREGEQVPARLAQ